MKIELKKFQFFERMSEETNAFVAEVYADGVKVAYAKNDGHGGSTYYHPEPKNREMLKKAEAHCESLPPIKYGAEQGMKAFEIKMNLEHFIDELVEAELDKKEKKKLEKKMEKSIMYGAKNMRGNYYQISFKVPLAQIPLAQLQAIVDKHKANIDKDGKGHVFWNTNFEKLGVKI